MARLDFDATAVPPMQEDTVQDPMHYFAQLSDDNPQEEIILQYLHALHTHARAQGVQCISVEQFYQEGALTAWHAAWDERPQETRLPTHIDQLPIKFILYNALTPYHCNLTNMDVVTMLDRVQRAHKIMSAWLAENENLETPADKRARQNRDAQKRYRARNNENDQSPEARHLRATKQAYDDYLQACRDRREAMEKWADYVHSKKKAWESLKNQTPQ